MKSQSLKDNICLVPCSGLYADITEDSLKQTMMEGILPKHQYFNFTQ